MPPNNPQIAAFAAALNGFVTEIDTAVNGITGDVSNLKAQLEAIQNSPGTLSPEDQASLDAALASVGALSGKVKTLDDATPPAVPGGGGTPEVPPVV